MKEKYMIKTSAPARVDLSGGAADMFEGCTLSAAINLRTYSFLLEKKTKKKELKLIRAVKERFKIDDNITFNIITDIPERSGLGGSGSIVVSCIAALNEYKKLNLNKFEIAEHAQRCESLGLGMKNGYQDWYISTFGGVLFMNFKHKRNKEINEEPFAIIEDLTKYMNLYFVVADTGVKHSSNISNKLLDLKYMNGDQKVIKLIEKLNILSKKGRDFIISRNLEKLADTINKNQEIIRKLERSSPENEKLIETALENGALAAKVTGAGCGGAIVALCKNNIEQKKVANALRKKSKFVHICKIDDGVRIEN